jgi:hypothetical protein
MGSIFSYFKLDDKKEIVESQKNQTLKESLSETEAIVQVDDQKNVFDDSSTFSKYVIADKINTSEEILGREVDDADTKVCESNLKR